MNKATERLLNMIAIAKQIEEVGTEGIDIHKVIATLGIKSKNGCNVVTLQRAWANARQVLRDGGYKTVCPNVRKLALKTLDETRPLKRGRSDYQVHSMTTSEIKLEIAKRIARL